MLDGSTHTGGSLCKLQPMNRPRLSQVESCSCATTFLCDEQGPTESDEQPGCVCRIEVGEAGAEHTQSDPVVHGPAPSCNHSFSPMEDDRCTSAPKPTLQGRVKTGGASAQDL